MSIHLLTTRLATLKHSATVAREARVQAQEVGVINMVRFSQGDTGWGYLEAVPSPESFTVNAICTLRTSTLAGS